MEPFIYIYTFSEGCWYGIITVADSWETVKDTHTHGRVAGAIPHSDAASQDALDGASVEGAHDGGRGSGSSEFACHDPFNILAVY